MIATERLILREWRDEDGAEFMRVTNTPAVMAHLGGVQDDPGNVRATIARQHRYQETRGHCMWIIERRADGALLGCCGLQPCAVGPIEGEIEIGWRLREDAWGQGHAREGAEASLAWGRANLACPRIVAITVPANARSWGLMERIGMERRADLDFDHPGFPDGSPLRRHITYVIALPAR